MCQCDACTFFKLLFTNAHVNAFAFRLPDSFVCRFPSSAGFVAPYSSLYELFLFKPAKADILQRKSEWSIKKKQQKGGW